MILTTTPTVEGRPVLEHLGIVAGEAIVGANLFRDLFAAVRDIVGGRSGAYEEVMRDARETALREIAEEAERLGANAVVGISFDYETIGGGSSILMVAVTGTAVRV
jgi:uncharacterized protein YbjQ (UPF0145 family)